MTTGPGSAMLQIRKLEFSYGDLQVLWNVDLEVKQGEIVTVVGANGAGKSTILKNVSRLVRPTRGSVRLGEVDLGQLQPHEVVEHGVIQVPEGRRIFSEMTVVENLRMGSFVKSTRKDRERNMDRVFSLFPRLAERKDQLGGTMSGVEQNVYQSLRIAHRAYVLETGRVVLSGTGAELLGNDHVRKAFLGI